MIKIIKGTYGYKNPDTGWVEPKNSTSDPFSISAKEEKRLVDAGYAEYVDNKAPEPVSAEPTKEELISEAKKKGIDIPKKASKETIKSLLDEAESDSQDGPDVSALMPE